MSRIIAITNQKGGVGKTTTSINLASAIADMNKKVLLVDFDPQANATAGLGVELSENDKTIMNAISDKTQINDCIKKSVKKNLDVLSGDVELSSLESELVGDNEKERKLKEALDMVKENYDYIFIDCPPAVGILNVNALIASDACIIPLQCEYFALEGLNQVMSVIDLIKQKANPELRIEGILFTMYDSRTRLSQDVVKGVRESVNAPSFETLIPRNVRLAEAPSNGLSIFEYDSSSIGSVRYKQLAKEIISKNEV